MSAELNDYDAGRLDYCSSIISTLTVFLKRGEYLGLGDVIEILIANKEILLEEIKNESSESPRTLQ